MESDLDTKTDGSTHDVSIGGSSMRAKNSITARPLKSEAQPLSETSRSVVNAEPDRRSLRALSKSQVLPVNTSKNSPNTTNKYASFNGHVRSNKRQPSTSSVTEHSRTSSVPDPSDSDIDSYSDIIGQHSWKDTVISNKGVDLSGDSSRQNSVPRSWASSSNPAGSVISFGNQQRRVIEDPARTSRQNSKGYETVMNGTRQSVPNLSTIDGDGLPRENGAYRGRTQRRTRSESQDLVQQNGLRIAVYGRSKSTPRHRENGSSDEDEKEHARNRRWKSSSTDLRANHVVIGTNRTNQPEILRVSSVDLPRTVDLPRHRENGSSDEDEKEHARNRRWKSSSTDLRPNHVVIGTNRTNQPEILRVSSVDLPRTTPTRNGELKSNHADQLAAEMQQGRRNSLNGRKQSFPRFRDDSQSSQDSTDYESRQTAAEKAAAALMSNHVTHVPTQSLTDRRNSQPLEMRNMNAENRKLRREHLANLAHLQSSSC